MLDIFNFIDNSLLFENFGDEFVSSPNLDAGIVGIVDDKEVDSRYKK